MGKAPGTHVTFGYQVCPKYSDYEQGSFGLRETRFQADNISQHEVFRYVPVFKPVILRLPVLVEFYSKFSGIPTKKESEEIEELSTPIICHSLELVSFSHARLHIRCSQQG